MARVGLSTSHRRSRAARIGRMNGARVFLLLGLTALTAPTAAACGSFGTAAERGDAASSDASDANTSEAGANDCTLVVDHDFVATPVDGALWTLLGEANVSSGGVVLTNHKADTGGAIYWSQMIDLSHLVVKMEIVTEGTASAGVVGGGIAFAWVATTPKNGNVGNNYGLCKEGVRGYAVVYDSAETRVQVYGELATCEPLNPSIDRDLRGPSTLEMDLTTTRVSVAAGANPTPLVVSLAPDGPRTGYFGVSAATGPSDPGRHVLRRLRVERCAP